VYPSSGSRLGEVLKGVSGPLIVCLLGLPALSPLYKSTLPRSFDGMFHLFRLLEIDQLLHQLVLFPRWAPDFFYGYGYPVFDFVPHLPYYLADVPHLLGIDLVHSLLASFALAVLASGLAMFTFVRDVSGAKAAVVSAAAYMYAPFHLYDLLFRGHLPGAWAMVLFPLVLWAFRRLITEGRIRYLALGSLLYAASFLTHNPAHLIFTAFLLFYVVILLVFTPGHRSRTTIRVGTSLLLASGLAAFFWVPALWDRQFVQLERMVSAPELDYHNNFISIAELLAFPPTADTGLMNPGVPNTLGPALVVLSAIAAMGIPRLHGRQERIHSVIFLCGLAGVMFMVFPQSAPVWERIPILRYLMFPHRFLRLGALLMAGLSGAVTRLFTDDKRFFSPSFGVASLSVAALIISAFPILYPPYYDQLPLNPTYSYMMEFERETGTVGTTSFGEYLPTWVEWVPTTSPLEPMYASSATVRRLERASIPQGATVLQEEYTPLSASVRLRASTGFTALFNGLYFPGWIAYLDGQEVSLAPSAGLGLITVPIPAGEHAVELRFADTPVWAASQAMSMVSIVALAAICCISAVRHRRESVVAWLSSPRKAPDPSAGAVISLSGAQAAALAVVAIGLSLIKVGFLDTHQSWAKRDFDGLHVPEAQETVGANFGDQVTLLSYDLPSSTPHPGDVLHLNLYWKARTQLSTDYSAFVHLVDEGMNIYAQKDALNPGGYPAHLWPPDEYNRDSHDLEIPFGTPPGDYLLGVGLYDPATMMRLPILEETGHQSGMYFLQHVTVAKASVTPPVENLGIQYPADATFDNEMTLLGFTPDRDHLVPGDFYRLALFWRAEDYLGQDFTVALRLVTLDGEEVLSVQSEPSAGRYPTTLWARGEIVRDNHAVWIPEKFPAGEYELELALRTASGTPVPRTPPAPSADWMALLSVPAGG
jgi:hypothetical protein